MLLAEEGRASHLVLTDWLIDSPRIAQIDADLLSGTSHIFNLYKSSQSADTFFPPLSTDNQRERPAFACGPTPVTKRLRLVVADDGVRVEITFGLHFKIANRGRFLTDEDSEGHRFAGTQGRDR